MRYPDSFDGSIIVVPTLANDVANTPICRATGDTPRGWTIVIGVDKLEPDLGDVFPRVNVEWRQGKSHGRFSIDARNGQVISIFARDLDVGASVDNPIPLLLGTLSRYRINVAINPGMMVHPFPTWTTAVEIAAGTTSARLPIPAYADSFRLGTSTLDPLIETYTFNGPNVGDVVSGLRLPTAETGNLVPVAIVQLSGSQTWYAIVNGSANPIVAIPTFTIGV